MSAEVTQPLDRAEARALTDEVKRDAARLWAKLLALYEGGAHLALGYSSWGAYYAAEFGGGQSHGYRLLESARVVEALAHSPIGERPTSEGVARELAPVLVHGGQGAVRDLWAETVERHGPEPTAREVRAIVRDAVLNNPERLALEAARPADFDRAANAEMLRRAGAFRRLLRDLTTDLGTPADFVASQTMRDHATEPFGDLARAGIAWLTAFLTEWEETA